MDHIETAIINQGKVYWKNKRVESTPQTAANIGLSYRSRNIPDRYTCDT